MAAPEAPSGAGATPSPSPSPETVTFAARDATSGPDADLVSRVFLRCAWRHDDRSFDVTLVAPGTGTDPPTVWRALNRRQPSNVRFDNWYDRAFGALASLEAGDHFRFEFAPKTRSAGPNPSALPGGVGAFLRASDATDADCAAPPTAALRWTWREAPASTRSVGDEGHFHPARLDANDEGRRLVGTAELERVDDTIESAHTLACLFGESARRNETLRAAVRALERDVAAATSAESNWRAELTRFAAAREASRADVAARVTLLLNEKKKKIRALELDLRAAGAQVDALEKTLEKASTRAPTEPDRPRRKTKDAASSAEKNVSGRSDDETSAEDDDADDADTEDEALELEARRRRSASRRSFSEEPFHETPAVGSQARVDGKGKRKARPGPPARRETSAAAAKKRRDAASPEVAADAPTDPAAASAGADGDAALGTQGTQGTLGTQVSSGTQRTSGTQRRQTTRKPGRRVIAHDLGDDLNLF